MYNGGFNFDEFLEGIMDILGVDRNKLDPSIKYELKDFVDFSENALQDDIDDEVESAKEDEYDEGHDDGYNEGYNDAVNDMKEKYDL